MLFHFWKSLSLQVCQLLCLNDVAHLGKVWCCERSDEGKNKVDIRASDAYLFFRRAFCISEGQTDVPRQSVWKQCLSEWSHQPLHFLALRPRNSLLCVLLLKKMQHWISKTNEMPKGRKKSTPASATQICVCNFSFFFFFANKSSSVALLKFTYAHEKWKGKKKSTPF